MGAKTDILPSADNSVQEQLRLPRLFRIVLINDSVTTMDFVVSLLCRQFSLSPKAAKKVMLNTHNRGRGIVGSYPFEIAEALAERAMQTARLAGFPLRCLTEPEESE